MTEEQIRAFFAHIEATRLHWAAEFYTVAGDYCALTERPDAIEFLDYDPYDAGGNRDAIPLLAFVDYEAAVRAERDRRDAEALRHEAQKEERERQEYERLRQKYR